jgi:8-oxo-dGTP pyrophosphatase MutT (NUDIX family)
MNASSLEPIAASLARLIQALGRPLPGAAAQLKMAPDPAGGPGAYLNPPAACRRSGVLILLYPRAGELHFVLTRRSQRVRHHKGQVSLPGGARHSHEPLIQTALRETGEDLGVPTAAIQVLGALSPLYVPVSGFCIHPFVAYQASQLTFAPDPVEVADVLEVPLAHLLDPAARQVEFWPDPRFDAQRRVPYFRIFDWTVWGATAMILSELVALLEEQSSTPPSAPDRHSGTAQDAQQQREPT